MANTDVWLQERVEGGGRITAGAVVEQSGGASRRPWFRVSESIRLAITHRADPFVAGASFAALREGGRLDGARRGFAVAAAERRRASVGLTRIECFEHDITNLGLVRMRYPTVEEIKSMQRILKVTRAAHVRASWVTALEISVLLNQLRMRIQRPRGILTRRLRAARRKVAQLARG